MHTVTQSEAGEKGGLARQGPAGRVQAWSNSEASPAGDSLGVPGRHHITNALGALAIAMRAGVDFHRAAAAASDFRGARRHPA